MSKHGHHPPDEIPDVDYIRNEDTAHELSDVNVGMLAKFIGILTVSMIVILIGIKFLSNAFERHEESLEWPPASRVNPPGTRLLPPEPRLQGAPGPKGPTELPLDEMKNYRHAEEVALTSYGWVNREAGVVRIPIEEAKKMLIEHGYGVKPAATPGPAAPKPAAPKPAAAVRSAGAGAPSPARPQ
jgi:hypothetical protein